MMTPADLETSGVYITVACHGSGAVCLEAKIQHRIVRLRIARSPDRARAAAAHASTAAQLTASHARRS
jgi:hypothetical protein